MNSNGLIQFQNPDFGSICALEKDGAPWFVGKGVAEALGYSNPRDALDKHVDEEDKGVAKCDTPGGRQSMTIINESGLYSLILSSKLPGAKAFKRWVTAEVLPSIRTSGGYTRAPGDPAKEQLAEAKLRNARARESAMWLKIAAAVESPSYRQVCASYASAALAGSAVIPLPAAAGKFFTATEVGQMFGVSANRIGAIANANGLKTEQFGRWFHDKSPYSSKEVMAFRYNQAAVEAFTALLQAGKEAQT